MILRDKDLDESQGLGANWTWEQAVEEHRKAKEAEIERAEKLAALAQAYKEGLEAGGKEEAERRMVEKFEEINPPETEAE